MVNTFAGYQPRNMYLGSVYPQDLKRPKMESRSRNTAAYKIGTGSLSRQNSVENIIRQARDEAYISYQGWPGWPGQPQSTKNKKFEV